MTHYHCTAIELEIQVSAEPVAAEPDTGTPEGYEDFAVDEVFIGKYKFKLTDTLADALAQYLVDKTDVLADMAQENAE